MNWDIIEGKWDQVKGSIKEKWGDLTDNDLTEMAGKRDKIAGKLRERYGWSKEEAERRVTELLRDKN